MRGLFLDSMYLFANFYTDTACIFFIIMALFNYPVK